VAEWTSSRATSKLYNDLEWVLTLPSVEGNGEGKLIPNPDYTVPPEKLNNLLYKETDLWQYFAVKGGSWADEFHYLNPEAVQIHRGDYRSAKIGFRTVIRIVRGQ
jgi:formylglycine-generating enzyme required for sulfatase activity